MSTGAEDLNLSATFCPSDFFTRIGRIFSSGIGFGEAIIIAEFFTLAFGLVEVKALDIVGGLDGHFL